MKPHESEPLPKGDPAWKEVIETGFNLDIGSLKEGHAALTEDLAFMARDLNGIIQSMTKNPLEVAQNPQPYLKDVQDIRNAFQKIGDRRIEILNPNGIHPLGFAGSLTSPEILNEVEFLKAYSGMLAEDNGLKPHLQRYELAYLNVGQLLKITEIFLNPHSPLIAGTRGKILLLGDELVNLFAKGKSEKE